MNKIRLAQALVPIADELDERGLEEEASELDEIIQDLVSEAKIESRMQRNAFDFNNFWGSGLQLQIVPQHRMQQENLRNQIRKIDQKIIQKQQELEKLRREKAVLLSRSEYQRGVNYLQGMKPYFINQEKMKYPYTEETNKTTPTSNPQNKIVQV